MRKFRGLSILIICLAIPVIFIAAKLGFDNEKKDALLMQALTMHLENLHYSPEIIDNDFSKRVFSLYLDRLDPNKRFFMHRDMKEFEKFQIQIDDEIESRSFDFFNLVNETYQKRFDQIQTYYEDFLSKPFDLNKVEEIFEADGEKLDYTRTLAEHKERWREFLKYQVLSRTYDAWKAQEAKVKDDKLEGEPKTLVEFEAESRERVLKNYKNWSKRIAQDNHNDKLERYINTITSSYDPHTNYFSPREKENFDISMSGKLEGIGAQLRGEDGYTKVVKVIPGSASWKQGDLEINDLIIKVAQGDGEPVDVVDMKLDNVVDKIRGPKGTEVRLTVKKVDGTTKEIPIIRDVVIMEEGWAKSAIIDDGNGHKIGFIHLPKFYADFEDRVNGRSCARDVEKETKRLKNQGVDAIVIDLRWNSGGSLGDVVDMSGLYIPKGPIVQVKGKEGAPNVLDDTDGETLYDGPMVIMVNSYSASASEILAAALQDYKRAVIVGSNSTFGKGTVQRFFDMDRVVSPGNHDLKPLGSIKMTTQKFYRINGGTTQLKGVVPDIVLPDLYSYIEIGEKNEDFPLEWNEIKPAKFKSANKIGNLSQLQASSKERVAQNEIFRLIESNAKWLKTQREETTYPLTFDAFKQKDELSQKRSDEFEAVDNVNNNFTIVQTKEDAAVSQEKKDAAERFETWKKALNNDIYVNEVVSIVNDMLK